MESRIRRPLHGPDVGKHDGDRHGEPGGADILGFMRVMVSQAHYQRHPAHVIAMNQLFAVGSVFEEVQQQTSHLVARRVYRM